MPSLASPGFSVHTIEKQDICEKFFRYHHTSSIKGAIQNQNWIPGEYWHYDLNGGPGVYDAQGQIEGSPIIMVNTLRDVITPGPRRRLITRPVDIIVNVYENNKRTYDSLIKHFDFSFGYRKSVTQDIFPITGFLLSEVMCPNISGRVTFWNTSHDDCDCFPANKNTLGLIYSDENGAGIPLELLSKFAREYPLIDILIHCTATAIKRTRLAYPGKPSLSDIIQSCPKEVWHIREPYGAWQWTFLYGCNWENAPILKQQKFHSMKSGDGAKIFRTVDQTANERAEDERADDILGESGLASGQPTLFT